MVKIEYDGVKIAVPENWDDLTLGFYETFYDARPETSRERVALVAKICKVDADVLMAWPAEVFNRIVSLVGFIFADNPTAPTPRVVIDGEVYAVNIESDLTLGEWVDVDEVQKDGVNVLSNVLAIVCRPTGEAYDCAKNEARRELFASLPVGSVLGVLAFFLHCKTAFDKRTAIYSRIKQSADHLQTSTKGLFTLGGGIKSLRIWPTIKYLILIALLRYRLRRFSRSFNTKKTKTARKRRSAS